MIITRTPFRISFFGGGTDFPSFFREHGGCTLSTSINKYCYILIHPLNECFGYRYKASYARTELVRSIEEFEHPLVRETLLYCGITTPLEIAHVSDLPGRTGLGASSSFTVGMLKALSCLEGKRVSKLKLAQDAVHIERERVGDAGGYQDQYAAAFGGMNVIDYSAEGIKVTPLPIQTPRLEHLQRHLLMFYVGHVRASASIAKRQDRRTRTNLPALLRMNELTAEARKVLLSGQDLKGFGELMHESWQLKKGLSQGISRQTIDSAYATARRAGAWGGKVLGSGGGGFLLFVAPPRAHAAIRAGLSRLHPVDIAFDQSGAEIIARK